MTEKTLGVPSGGGAQIARAALPALLVLAGATYLSVLTVARASQEVYGIPDWGVVVTGVLLGLIVVGCGLIAWSRQPAFSAVVVAAVALTVLGFLAVLSFGVLALPVAAALMAWAGSGRWRGAHRGRATVGALLAGAPLPLLISFALAGPLVDCDPDAVTSGENVFLAMQSARAGTSSASGSDGPNGTLSGRAEGDGYAYSYVCRDGRLLSFELRWR